MFVTGVQTCALPISIQIGAVFAILLIIPSALLIFVMRKYIGPEAIAGGFKMK